MKRNLLYLLCFGLLISCIPEKPVPVKDFPEKRLVLEGYFTSENETQEFSVSLVSNIGDSSLKPVDNITLELSDDNQTYSFYQDGNRLISEVSFAGVPGTVYDLHFCYQDSCYTEQIEMPVKTSITDFFVEPNTNFETGIIQAKLNSSVDQFIRYEIYQWSSFEFSDTNWTVIPQPIYWTTFVSAGEHTYELSEDHADHFTILGATVVKIKVYALSNKTGLYFKQLENFMNGGINGSQYQNPPYLHSGHVYGAIYGTVVDSALFAF